MDVTFRHGDPITADYYPTAGDVPVGTVVLLGVPGVAGVGCVAGVAHHAIVNNTAGALAVGGGVYDAINLSNAANGAKVYWDNVAKKVSTVSANNAVFGFVVQNGGLGVNSICRVLHQPYYGGA